MTYNLVFQYKEAGRFPEEHAQDEPIVLEQSEVVGIPAVGDYVTFTYDGLPTDFQVLSRHFAYSGDNCTVNVEVGAALHLHKALSLKE